MLDSTENSIAEAIPAEAAPTESKPVLEHPGAIVSASKKEIKRTPRKKGLAKAAMDAFDRILPNLDVVGALPSVTKSSGCRTINFRSNTGKRRDALWTYDNIYTLCQAVADGVPIQRACDLIGCDVKALWRKCQREPQLAKALAKSKAMVEWAMARKLIDGGKDWLPAATWLGRRYPAEWSEKRAMQEVSDESMNGIKKIGFIPKQRKTVKAQQVVDVKAIAKEVSG